MKKIFLLAIACFTLTIAANAQQADTTIKFTSATHDFGEIKQGIPATYKFEFTNTGKEPIIIQNVQPSCGCTSPNWTKEPIAPGAKGEIEATYNAAAIGFFNKSLTVISNASPSMLILHIKGTVVMKQE